VSHHYGRQWKEFNGSTEEEKAPKTLNGEQLYERMRHFMPSCEKVKQNIIEKNVENK